MVLSPALSSKRAHRSMRRPDDHVIVVFGATGDLAKRKLLPGLFRLAVADLLPRRFRIVGTARLPLSAVEFREHAHDAVAEFGTIEPNGDAWKSFENALSFGAADQDDSSPLVSAVHEAEEEIGGNPRRLFHLAVPPVAFESVIDLLGSSGLADRLPGDY